MSWYFLGGFSAYWMVPSGRFSKPLFVLFYVRVIGRDLERNIERHLHSEIRDARLTKAPEILKRAELRMDRFVSALLRPNRPWTSDIVGSAVMELFLPLRNFLPIG